jgi:hypothetical protein
MVRNGEWTWDRAREFMATVAVDMTGSGVHDSIEDRWGLAAPDGDFNRAFFMSLGGRFFATNPATGRLYAPVATPSGFEVARTMREIVNTPGLVWGAQLPGGGGRGNTGINYTWSMFNDGRALFLGYMAGWGRLRDKEDDWGMLPMPRATAGAPVYVNKVDHNAPIFGMTITNREYYYAGHIMEAMGARFANVRYLQLAEVEDIMLRSDDDADMIAFIDGHGGYDLALIMQNAHESFRTPFSATFGYVFVGNVADFAAEMESVRDVMEYNINLFLERD